MSPLRVRRLIRRCRRHHAVVLAVLAVGCAVGMHHTTPVIANAHHDAGVGEVVELCLGVVSTVGAVLSAVALALLIGVRRPPIELWASVGLGPSPVPPVERARAGPARLVALCVSRC